MQGSHLSFSFCFYTCRRQSHRLYMSDPQVAPDKDMEISVSDMVSRRKTGYDPRCEPLTLSPDAVRPITIKLDLLYAAHYISIAAFDNVPPDRPTRLTLLYCENRGIVRRSPHSLRSFGQGSSGTRYPGLPYHQCGIGVPRHWHRHALTVFRLSNEPRPLDRLGS